MELRSVNRFALCNEARLSPVGLFRLHKVEYCVLARMCLFGRLRHPKLLRLYGLSRAGIPNHVIGQSAIQRVSSFGSLKNKPPPPQFFP